jgi:hypothetical protein
MQLMDTTVVASGPPQSVADPPDRCVSTVTLSALSAPLATIFYSSAAQIPKGRPLVYVLVL